MIHLPLRAKIALWSALAAGLALAAALVGIHFFLRIELRELIDRRMDKEAWEVYWDLDRQAGGPMENRTEITEDLMPAIVGNRLIELYNPAGKQIFRSSELHESLAGGQLNRWDITYERRPYRVGKYYHKQHTMYFAYPLGNYFATLGRVTWAIVVVLPGVVLFSVLGGCWVAARALRPVQKISESARQITAEDLHRRLPVPPARDEIHQLTEVLNDAFSRLEKSYNQAMHFASDASHQLKTPITVMRVAIEDVLHDPTLKPEHTAALGDLLQQTRRLSSLTDGLLLLAKADAGHLTVNMTAADLTQVVLGVIEDAEIIADAQDIRIESELPAKIRAMADPLRTEQILLNLLENAVKYNEPGGIVRLRAESKPGTTSIRVMNTGRPIPKEKAPYVFDRFVRGEANEGRSGHGLGLALARELARAQGGELVLVRSDQEWTEFELRLRAPTRLAGAEEPELVATS